MIDLREEDLALLFVVDFFVVGFTGDCGLDIKLDSAKVVSFFVEDEIADGRVFVAEEGEAAELVCLERCTGEFVFLHAAVGQRAELGEVRPQLL
jgi:hypothetical protein